MLRITLKSQTPEEVVLEIAGWLAGEDVNLIEQEMARWHRQARQLVLDMEGIKFIDENGLTLLKHWSDRQVVLRGGSAFVRKLLESYGLV